MIALMALPLAGCENFKTKDQSNRLDQALSAYTGAIRWGNYDTAMVFAVPRSGTGPGVNPDALVGLKVTGFTTRINRVNPTADEANVTVGFTYYHQDRTSIRQVEQTATWYFDPVRQGWLMDSPMPEFSR